MSIFQSITEMLGRYGNRIEVEARGRRSWHRAIIQPLQYKNRVYLAGSVIPSGYLRAGNYLMIAPIDVPIEDGRETYISDGELRYAVKHVDKVKAEDRDLYYWAVLTPCTPKAKDDYDED